ncbi:hypothetical protein [Enterobacter mori]|uniref:hypothetical protein n=1 Tax=Enterobacter mori TaxID=539813 RepID=UPI003B8442E4
MGLSTYQLRKIEDIFEARSQMKSRGLESTGYQKPAESWKIFELQRIDDNTYYFIPDISVRKKMNPALPKVHGPFLFVIMTASPGQVFCGVDTVPVRARPEFYEPNNEMFEVGGHTSLSMRRDVLFAGEILFNHGMLVKWTNESGHYAPEADLIESNFLPHIQRLLPLDKFIDEHPTPRPVLPACWDI